MKMKKRVSKKEFEDAGGISNPDYSRIMKSGVWTYWKIN